MSSAGDERTPGSRSRRSSRPITSTSSASLFMTKQPSSRPTVPEFSFVSCNDGMDSSRDCGIEVPESLEPSRSRRSPSCSLRSSPSTSQRTSSRSPSRASRVKSPSATDSLARAFLRFFAERQPAVVLLEATGSGALLGPRAKPARAPAGAVATAARPTLPRRQQERSHRHQGAARSLAQRGDPAGSTQERCAADADVSASAALRLDGDPHRTDQQSARSLTRTRLRDPARRQEGTTHDPGTDRRCRQRHSSGAAAPAYRSL